MSGLPEMRFFSVETISGAAVMAVKAAILEEFRSGEPEEA